MEEKTTAITVAPKGAVTIPTEEYAYLIARNTLLEVVLAASDIGGYCPDSIIKAICKAFPEPERGAD